MPSEEGSGLLACFWSGFAWHALAALAIFAGGNVINDVCDVEVDRINAPTRPLPSGEVSTRAAVAWTGLLFGIGGGASVVAGWISGYWATGVALWAIGWLIVYSLWLKGRVLVGNVTIAMLAGLLVLYGAHAVGGQWYSGIVGAVFAFGTTFARELVKDLADVEGDRALGLRTLAIVSPMTARALVMLSALTVFAFGGGFAHLPRSSPLLSIALGVILVLGVLAMLTRSADRFRAQAIAWKITMLVGMGALILASMFT